VTQDELFRHVGVQPGKALRPRLALVACAALGVALLPWVENCRAETQEVVCDDGNGMYETQMHNGVTVRVGPPVSGGFSARACSASLILEGAVVTAVAPTAQVDIDVLGADLGFGVPVVAFQVRRADDTWRASYVIYSLDKNPRLLATITGGDLYRASDADFDKRVAIWTTDAAAVNGFDDLTYADLDAPTIVLRYEHGRLMDVSAEYQAQYDRQIAQMRAQLDAQALSDFRKSDGRLALGSVPGADLVRLRKTKAKVLGIVWAYLYSGRDQQAWAELSELWPAADADRAKAAILSCRAKGIEAQVAGVAGKPSPGLWKKHPYIYETEKASGSGETNEASNLPDLGRGVMPTSSESSESDAPTQSTADTPPRYFLMRAPPGSPVANPAARTTERMTLTIDETGKVWSAKMEAPEQDPTLVAAAMGWKFVPAFKGGHPVACIYRMTVSPEL